MSSNNENTGSNNSNRKGNIAVGNNTGQNKSTVVKVNGNQLPSSSENLGTPVTISNPQDTNPTVGPADGTIQPNTGGTAISGTVTTGAGDQAPPIGTGGKGGEGGTGRTLEQGANDNVNTEGQNVPQESINLDQVDIQNVQGVKLDNKGSVNVGSLLKGTQSGIKTADEKITSRKEKADLLTKAINSQYNFETIQYINDETGEVIGTKIRYLPDTDEKTIYDYMEDEDISAHLGFKVPEGDNKDGQPVDSQISVYWVNPVF